MRVRRLFIILFLTLFLVSLASGILLFPIFKVAYLYLGFDHPKEYVVLFQNNMELRPTGGFLGSFGRIHLDKGKVTLVKIEDIYVPDGQLDGHVDPPWPIQAAFGQGWWKLRDSNYDPDFSTSVKTIEWFLVHGKESPADGVIAVNLSLLEKLLRVIGPIYVTDLPEKVTADNFYKTTQAAVEIGFFPGSVQKGNYLSKVGSAIFREILQLSLIKKLQLPKLVFSLLKEKQILIASHDPIVEAWLKSQNFAGSLTDVSHSKTDYLAFFESNLGANKANCCIQRNVILRLNKNGAGTNHELTIHYDNLNPTALKIPPQYWGGAYVDFLRIGIPIDAKASSLVVGNVTYPVSQLGDSTTNGTLVDLMRPESDQELRSLVANDDPTHIRIQVDERPDLGIKFVGFFIVVEALDSKDVKLQYDVPFSADKLLIQKQSGIESYPLSFYLGKHQAHITVKSDLALPISL